MAPRRLAAMQRAISLIQRVSDMTAPRNYLAETREYLVNAGIVAAVANHDTQTLYCWLMEIISHQGIADRIARDYLDRHGRARPIKRVRRIGRLDSMSSPTGWSTVLGCP